MDIGERGEKTKKMEINKKIDVLEENKLDELGTADDDIEPEVQEGTPPTDPNNMDGFQEFCDVTFNTTTIKLGSNKLVADQLLALCIGGVEHLNKSTGKRGGGSYVG